MFWHVLTASRSNIRCMNREETGLEVSFVSLVIQHKAAALNPESSQPNQSSWAESMLWAESWYEKQHRETRQCDCLESEIMDVTVPCWRAGWPGPFQTVFTQTTSTQQTQPWNLFPVLNYPSSCSLSTCCAADFQLASVPCRRTQSVAVMSVIRDTTNWKIEHIIMQNIYTIYRHTVVKASLSDLSPLQLRFCLI